MDALKDKVVWVTGAGSGTGRSTALLFAELGAKVALWGRRRETVVKAAEEIEARNGVSRAEAVDVGVRGQVKDAAARLLGAWGRVDVLVNNAGLNVPKRRFAEVSDEDFDGMIQANLVGAYNMIQAVLPPMREQGEGVIVNVSSMAGKQAHPMSGPGYCSSKFGLVGLSHTVNAEEWPNGIRATALCPGEINTPFVDRRTIVPPSEERSAMIQPEDMAGTIVFLATLPPNCTVPELWIVPSRPRTPLPGETI